MRFHSKRFVAFAAATSLVIAACGGDDATDDAAPATQEESSDSGSSDSGSTDSGSTDSGSSDSGSSLPAGSVFVSGSSTVEPISVRVAELADELSGGALAVAVEGPGTGYPYFPTTVIDNFYDEPDLWREYALDQEYFKGKRGSWPGLRTKLFHENNMPLFNLFANKLLYYIRDYGFTTFTEVQTAFHMTGEEYGRGWVHDDDPKLNIAGVIYLNKEAPLGSGTVVYEDKEDLELGKYAETFMRDVLAESEEERKPYQEYRNEQTALFNKSVTMESVYNRCIMFDTRAWHSAEKFFGKDKDSSRLTQVFFVKAV